MKTIITLDKADQPYGFPQLDGSGSLHATGSLYGTSSYALNSETLNGTGSGVFATTGSNTFYGLQTISASGTDLSVLDLHMEDDSLWAFRIYNDTYSSSSIGLASWIDNTGISFLGTETDKPLYIYNNANYYNPTLLISSSGITVGAGGITGSLLGTSSWASNALTASLAPNYTLTSSFNNFTSSYYQDSSSFDTRIDNLEQFSSSLDATFATDDELNAATASLSSSISSLSSSFESFSGSYNTGTFSGSFSGSGADLFDIPASGITGLNLSQISSGSVSASISPNNGLQINTNVTATSFTGSFTGDGSGLTDLPISQLIREEFTWTSGSSQTFQLLSTASQVYTVEVQGQGALSTTQYDRPALNSVRILDTLENGDYLTVLYSTTVVGVDPYYTQGQIDTLVGNKVDKVTTSGVERVYTINADGSQGVKSSSKVGEIIIAKFFPAAFGINSTDQWYTSGQPFLNGAWNTSAFYGSGSIPTFAIDYRDKPSLINSFNKPLKSIIWAIDYGDWYQLDLCIIKTDSFSNQQSNHRVVLMPYNIRVLTTTPSLNHPGTAPFSKYQIEIPVNDTMDTPANAFNSAYHLFIKGQSSAGSNRATIYFKF